jgi:hypothetical protein
VILVRAGLKRGEELEHLGGEVERKNRKPALVKLGRSDSGVLYAVYRSKDNRIYERGAEETRTWSKETKGNRPGRFGFQVFRKDTDPTRALPKPQYRKSLFVFITLNL